jgi:APA family basic amino acid/polyamine antiporter
LLFISRFQALFSLAIFSEWLAYGLTASTIFVFRRREAAADRPFSVPGYPVVPVLFILAALVLMIFSIEDQPINSLGGLGVILCGIPVYLLYRRRGAERPNLR